MILYYGGEDYKEYDRNGVTWVDGLEQIAERDIEILVLFSEPTAEDLYQIQKMDMNRVFAYEGIHVDCTKFRSVETLNRLIVKIQEERAEEERERYLESLGEMDDEERDYLIRHYRPDILSNHIFETESLKIRNYSGKLITYRGSNQLFKIFVSGMAKKNREHNILLIDGDLLKPSFDEIFRVRQVSTKEGDYITGRDNTGMNVALDLLKRKASVDDILRKTTSSYFGFFLKAVAKNLFFKNQIRMMLGNYNIYNYENYDLSLLQKLISAMLQRFDLVIVKLSNELHDEFAMSMIHRCDYHIMAIRNLKSEIRYYSQVYDMLVVRQDIDKNKICILKGYSAPDGLFSYLFKGSHKGNVQHIVSKIWRL